MVEPAARAAPQPLTLSFRGIPYEHRWSKRGQNEFTPPGQTNLNAWKDMLTLNLLEKVTSGEQLAAAANRVLANYQAAGKIVRTSSQPRTASRPAEHLVVAVLGRPGVLEASFARLVLVEGVGTVVVYSHRAYGSSAAPTLGAWLQAQGPQVEAALMAWKPIPNAPTLRALPQSP